MTIDAYNLKLQRVKPGDEEAFKASTPKEGETHFRLAKRYISVGDGTTSGGVALASKDFVLNAIRVAEANGTTGGISPD